MLCLKHGHAKPSLPLAIRVGTPTALPIDIAQRAEFGEFVFGDHSIRMGDHLIRMESKECDAEAPGTCDGGHFEKPDGEDITMNASTSTSAPLHSNEKVEPKLPLRAWGPRSISQASRDSVRMSSGGVELGIRLGGPRAIAKNQNVSTSTNVNEQNGHPPVEVPVLLGSKRVANLSSSREGIEIQKAQIQNLQNNENIENIEKDENFNHLKNMQVENEKSEKSENSEKCVEKDETEVQEEKNVPEPFEQDPPSVPSAYATHSSAPSTSTPSSTPASKQIVSPRAASTMGHFFSAAPVTFSERYSVIKEVMDTERFYVSSLSSFLGTYVLSFQEQLPGEKEAAEKLFGNIRDIFDANRSFLVSVLKRVKSHRQQEVEYEKTKNAYEEWRSENPEDPEDPETPGKTAPNPPQYLFADLFIDFLPRLPLYVTYCNGYDRFLSYYRSLKAEKKPGKVLTFLRKCQENDARGQELPHYLIMPSQRLMRYRMLLAELKKKTPPDHPDVAALDIVLEKICKIADMADRVLDTRKMLTECAEIQALLHGKDVPNLVAANRTFIMQGPMIKIGKREKRKRWFYLFNDLLVYGSKEEWTKDSPCKVLGTVDLRTALVEDKDKDLVETRAHVGGSLPLGSGANEEKEEKGQILEKEKEKENKKKEIVGFVGSSSADLGALLKSKSSAPVPEQGTGSAAENQNPGSDPTTIEFYETAGSSSFTGQVLPPFSLSVSTQTKSFLAACDSQEEKNRWLKGFARSREIMQEVAAQKSGLFFAASTSSSTSTSLTVPAGVKKNGGSKMSNANVNVHSGVKGRSTFALKTKENANGNSIAFDSARLLSSPEVTRSFSESKIPKSSEVNQEDLPVRAVSTNAVIKGPMSAEQGLSPRGQEMHLHFAPVWEPDAARSGCACCNTKFSTMNRRHHCRRCGRLVCNDCSKARIVLPHQGKSRVCVQCAALLTISGTGA